MGLFAALALTGCIAPNEMKDHHLLESYCAARWNVLIGEEKEMRAEILSRKLLTEEQLVSAEKYEIKIGDSRNHVLAAWGNPNGVDNLETADAIYETYWWTPISGAPEIGGTVYLKNGYVVGISR